MKVGSTAFSFRRLVGAFALVAVACAATHAVAQQPAPKSKPGPKGSSPKSQPQQKQQPQAQQPQQGEQPQISFSPWTKICSKPPDAGGKEICLTGKDGVIETGMPVVAAVLIEPQGEPKKVLRITLPLGVSLQPGTRAVVDQGQPMTAPYVICLQNGCVADYEASGELIANLKRGKGLAVQGMNGAGQVMTLVLPLSDFAKAYDGPPTDEKAFAEYQRKRYEQLQKKKQ
jgi:invasion protein IalB